MDDTPSSSRLSSLRFLLSNIFYIALAVGLAMFVQAFIARPFIVSGSSMDPIIKDKEYLIIDEVTYRTRDPQRGEVVVFRAPPEPKKYYIKRIIGLPGETIQIDGKKVTIINEDFPEGFVLDESYLVHHNRNDYVSLTIPDNHYFVMGDNRDGSYDSRGWGPLDEKAIRGRAYLRLLPLTAIDYLPGNHIYDETK